MKLHTTAFLLTSSLFATATAASSSSSSLRALQETFDCDTLDCDDGNDLTIDTCTADAGCQHECDDGNACTREIEVDGECQYVDANDEPYDCDSPDGSNCIPGLIDCSDGNPLTTDVCLPSRGCEHIGLFGTVGDILGLDSTLDDLDAEATIFYEEQSSLTEEQLTEVMDWIKLEVTQMRTPFCWRRSYGRGVGEPINSCPSGKERVGLLCLNECEEGFSRQGTLDCHQNCKEGWRDDGLFCRLAEYGRGVGFPWRFGDPLNDSGMFSRCEDVHGEGNCEKWGLIVYPKCREGYSPFGCCICRPSFDSCIDEGYANPRLDLSCRSKIMWGEPTPLQCREGLEQSGLLCYPPCDEGYAGVGPVCWQQCDDDQFGCVAGCARDAGDCIFALTDQLIAPAMVTANLATLGANVAPTAAAGTAIEVAGVLYDFATWAGVAMGWLADKLGVVGSDPNAVPANAIVVSFFTTGNTVIDGAVNAALYGAGAIMSRQFAAAFEDMTSPAIVQTMHANLRPADLLYAQRIWADIQFAELAGAEGWNIASLILSTVQTVDVTGISRLINAYMKPVCMEIFDFPVCTRNNCEDMDVAPGMMLVDRTHAPYEPECQDIEVFASADSDCLIELVDPILLDENADHPAHEHVTLELDTNGPFAVSSSSHSVTLTAWDANENEIDTCRAKIKVTDLTPATIACPILERGVDNDAGLCSATVSYSAPNVTDNCDNAATVAQTEGGASGSSFDVGTTLNTFEVTDSLGNTAECSFTVSVFDVEAPVLQACDSLEALLSTDAGACHATYQYTPPTATDNCDGSSSDVSVVLTDSPSLDPEHFPLGVSNVEYTATDEAGNVAACSFVVEVVDTEPPVASCEAVGESGNQWTVGGLDNCSTDAGTLKAYVVDSGSGTRFPTTSDYFLEVGTMFEYTVGSEVTEEQGSQVKLQGTGSPYVVLVDEAGNESPQAYCV